jgi:hypothetical protein
MKFRDYLEENKEKKAKKLFVILGDIYDGNNKSKRKALEKYSKQLNIDIEDDATSRDNDDMYKKLTKIGVTSSDILAQIDIEKNKDSISKLKKMLKAKNIDFSEGY